MVRRFPPPWSVEENAESYAVRDANGQPLGYFYFDDVPQRRAINKRLKGRGAADRSQRGEAAGASAEGSLDGLTPLGAARQML